MATPCALSDLRDRRMVTLTYPHVSGGTFQGPVSFSVTSERIGGMKSPVSRSGDREVRTVRLTTFHTLFVIDLATRRVCIAGTTRTPSDAFMAQFARNLTDVAYGLLRGHRKLIVDRDTKFTRRFRALLASGGVETILTPPKSPNCNANAERFVRSIKEECLGRMIFFGEAPLRRALREYVAHFNAERP